MAGQVSGVAENVGDGVRQNVGTVQNMISNAKNKINDIAIEPV